MLDGSEPVADHKIRYRRIPATSGFYDPHVDPNPSPLAFRPTQLDTTGLSLSRAKYKTLEQAGQGREGIVGRSVVFACRRAISARFGMIWKYRAGKEPRENGDTQL